MSDGKPQMLAKDLEQVFLTLIFTADRSKSLQAGSRKGSARLPYGFILMDKNMDTQLFLDLYALLDVAPISVDEMMEMASKDAPRKCKIVFPT
ncbi:hypothetical protein C5749_16985 [Sphingobacterium gobiense]|uniref:Uncharacterized protein n=2 Tax=Sphingobacterium gobiense TaxID=1382456 RepID=A0A2S9JGA5_9SPHI|nr:hypothetical protein C5749_16985 [Sphingobacterium gobiense]